MYTKAVVFFVLLFLYLPIFTQVNISGGDLPFYWTEYINSLSIPYVWNPHWPTGLGGNQAIILPLKLYLQIPLFLFTNILGVPWNLILKVFLLWTVLFLSVISSYKLSRSWLGVLIYTVNTWLLMVFSGGQTGIALAYAIAPLVLVKIFKNIKYFTQDCKSRHLLFRESIFTALVISLQFLFDQRITYITLIAVFLYLLIYIFHNFTFIKLKKIVSLFLYLIIFPLIITLLLHSFWILPFIYSSSLGSSPLAVVNSSIGEVKFLSFANFSNGLSLLHPNWPENIFGKTFFLRPEFLILPILAFSCLLFIYSNKRNKEEQNIKQHEKNTLILFFTFLGLLGAFLAKGSNPPFSDIYLWLYSNLPGFNFFRDPIKFYLLISLSYSVLIPITLNNFKIELKKISYNSIKPIVKLIDIVFIFYLIFLINPILWNKPKGIFQQKQIPEEYIKLEKFISSQNNFFRTLWVPTTQRYGFFSDKHPAISSKDFLNTTSEQKILKKLKVKQTLNLLEQASVKYIIVPYDSEGEIFLRDRKYDEKQYQDTNKEISKLKTVKRVYRFGKITVFELSNYNDHLWLTNGSTDFQSTQINPTKYNIDLKNGTINGLLVFAESYDPGWVIVEDGKEVKSKKYNNLLNSFSLENNKKNYLLYYKPQSWMDMGLIISSFTFLVVIGLLGYLVRKY